MCNMIHSTQSSLTSDLVNTTKQNETKCMQKVFSYRVAHAFSANFKCGIVLSNFQNRSNLLIAECCHPSTHANATK